MSRIDTLSSSASVGLNGLSSSMSRIWRPGLDQDGARGLRAEQVLECVVHLGNDAEDHIWPISRYSRMIASSRFSKILHTLVQAACSATSRFVGRGDMPTSTSLTAASWFA